MSLTIDSREFEAALREYMPHTKRDLAEVINQKAYSICVAASKITHAASYQKMLMEVGPIATEIIGQRVRITKHKGVKRGKLITRKVFASTDTGPRMALIVNRRLGRQGKPGLYGPDMREAVESKWTTRARAIGFVRAGWLAPLFAMAGALGIKARTPSKKMFERSDIKARGWAKSAKASINPTAEFWNSSGSPITTKDLAPEVASDGLEKAIAQEIQRMGEHVAKKLQERANKYAARLVRV